jgi:hypothetical protein
MSKDLHTVALIEKGRLDPYWQDVALRGIGQRLHHYYYIVEKILENIFEAFGEGLPAGRSYHSNLLRQAFLELPTRPAIFKGEDLKDFLDELRRYRHFFRNLYRSAIKVENIRCLLERTVKHHPRIEEQLRRFAENLVSPEL